MNGSPFSPLPYDVVVANVLPYLNVQDLGRCLQINKTYFQYLLRDEAWEHVKQRCITAAPFLEPLVFDAFPWDHKEYDDETKRKKAKVRTGKKPLKLPRKGTWYGLKTYVGKARNAKTVRQLLSYDAGYSYQPPRMLMRHRSYAFKGTKIVPEGFVMDINTPPPANNPQRCENARIAAVCTAAALTVGSTTGNIRFNRITNCVTMSTDTEDKTFLSRSRHLYHTLSQGSTYQTKDFDKLYWF